MALLGFGVWSLVGGLATGTLLSCLGAWMLVPQRPALSFHWPTTKWVFGFAKHTFIAGLMEKVLHDLDDVVIGTLGSTRSLGFYNKSFRMAEAGAQGLFPPIVNTAFPTFAKLQSDRLRLSRAYEIILAWIMRLATLLYVLLGLLAPEIIRFLYGPKWLGVVPLLRLLLIYGLLSPAFNLSNSLHLAGGAEEGTG